MKFVLMVEDEGYQVCYWDQIFDTIGESIAANWDTTKLFKTLQSKGFNISKDTLERAVSKLDEGDSPFITLNSHAINENNLDAFFNDLFEIE